MTSGSATGKSASDRRGLAGRRAAVATTAATATLAVALAAGLSWSVSLLLAWYVAATVFLVWVWGTVARLDASRTARIAASEDNSRTAAEALLLGASIASLVAVGYVLSAAGRAVAGHRIALTALAVGSVILAWATVHTVYALRYARLFHAAPAGGIAFHTEEPPDYVDFAYVAVTVGMTYQVSDTDISKRSIRRAAIHHALLSYLFGAIILGIVISSIATILGS